jgi:hypothetical protein
MFNPNNQAFAMADIERAEPMPASAARADF